MILWCDFETRSRVNLLTQGVYNYAQSLSTKVLCLSYAFDGEEVKTIKRGDEIPDEIYDFKGQIRAHNAAFERLIFWYVLGINFKLEQFYCTATQSRANASPGSLEDVGRFAGTTMRKDHRGKQLIRLLSIPQADGTFNEDPVLHEENYRYCEQDVRTMREISKAQRDLTDDELMDYHVAERMNDLGIKVDVPLAKAAMGYAKLELDEVQSLVTEITGGEITSVRSPKMAQWVTARLGEDALKQTEVYKDGVKKTSMDKNVRAALIAMADEYPDQVPPEVADVLQCASDVWASSTAKFQRMVDSADEEDHRVRGAFVFNGAGGTGRMASYGLQLQNLYRRPAKEPLPIREAMLSNAPLVPTYGNTVSEVLKSMIRPAFIPEDGNVFVCADWSGIEARVNPWLSNCPHGDKKLDVFRKGEDVYVVNAAATFHTNEVTPDQRQVGKVQELACGFAGGVGAFAAMGKLYGVNLPEALAKRMVSAWRRANPWSIPYWQDLETAYTRAIRNRNTEYSVGRVTYLFDGLHLWLMLPSGRILCYPYAKLDKDGVSYAKSNWKPKADATEWPRARLWKGLACENITQAVANDLLRYAMRLCAQEGLECCLAAHDELLLECKIEDAEKIMARLVEIMKTAPSWATGLPLDVKAKLMTRYGK